jgi:predicted TPR repeat methyltransferase
MKDDYADVFRSGDNVDKYDNVVYAADSHWSAVNRRERAFVRELVVRSFSTKPVQHDFACGTGRAMQQLSGLVREAHGYDTSEAMLAKAADAVPGAHLHVVDETGPVPAPATSEGPAIVTMFRLLLNVPAEVRDRAIAFAAGALPDRDAGLLVVENHGSRDSLRHLRARRQRGNRWFNELSHAEVRALFDRHGFEIIEQRAFSVVPQGAYKGPLRKVVEPVDGVAVKVPSAGKVGTTVLYVAKRRN